jgi:hypothetical protein
MLYHASGVRLSVLAAGRDAHLVDDRLTHRVWQREPEVDQHNAPSEWPVRNEGADDIAGGSA